MGFEREPGNLSLMSSCEQKYFCDIVNDQCRNRAWRNVTCSDFEKITFSLEFLFVFEDSGHRLS